MSEAFISAFDVLDREGTSNPARHQAQRALREELFAIRQQVRQHLDSGLPTTEIEAARGLLAAAESAEAVAGRLSA
jgi:hypothetical protein